MGDGVEPASFGWLDAAGIQATGNRTLFEPVSGDGWPETGKRYVVPPRAGRAVRAKGGQSIRVTNVHGTQVGDAWAFNAADMGEFMSMEHARAWLSRMTPRAGQELVTNRRRPILTLVEDSSPGVHDTFIAACDIYRYQGLGVETYHDNCTDNLRMALAAIGLEPPEIPSPLNLWMNIPIKADGSIGWLPTVSKAGDHVTFKAHMDCVFALSACPQDIIPINGVAGQPVELALEVLE